MISAGLCGLISAFVLAVGFGIGFWGGMRATKREAFEEEVKAAVSTPVVAEKVKRGRGRPPKSKAGKSDRAAYMRAYRERAKK